MFARLRPSPALVVATLALVVAASGSAYAVTAINGSSLVDHSVAGRKLVSNTLTGVQVNESKLAAVPRANNADAVGHITVRKVYYAPTTATGQRRRSSSWADSPSKASATREARWRSVPRRR